MKKSAPLFTNTICHPELDSGSHLTKDKKCFVSTGFTLNQSSNLATHAIRQVRTRTNAFTLIELLVVIVIIGILAAIGLAQFTDYQERARLARAQAFAKQAETLLKAKATSESLIPLLDLKFDQPNAMNAGNAGDGTVFNATWQSGDDCINGGCFYFNGTDARIFFPASNVNWQGQGSFTLSVWFQAENTNDGHVFRQGGDWSGLISLRVNSQSIRSEIGLHIGGGIHSIYSDAAYKNRWQYALLSYNAEKGEASFYVDGKFQKSLTMDTPITKIITKDMFIGAINNQAYFTGSIDDIALYPVALEF